MLLPSAPHLTAASFRASVAIAASVLLIAGCGQESKKDAARAPVEVTTITITPRDVPVSATYVAQTQSSQAVNIQARVSGFLDKRVYVEGSMVKAGQVLFQMDPKPFQAQLDAAQAALTRSQAALEVARANLARTKPLAAQNALSQKDLDDATGQYEQAAAQVDQMKAQVETAQLNLSYTTITSPVDGASSFAAVADGTYLDAKNSQLTTVSVLSPMWINFSVSENEMERIRREVRTGRIRLPPGSAFDVEIELVDGSLFPHKGKITFADPSFNPQTGTFLIRATVDNPLGLLRPNQYVRTRLIGAVRPNAIVVPQRAVQQGGKGQFVWIVNKDGLAETRPVTVGDWQGDEWIVNEGLAAGDVVVVDGALRLGPGAKVTAKPYAPATAPAPASQPTGATLTVHFASGKATLDAEAQRLLSGFAPAMKSGTNRIDVTGFADATGNHAANVALANRRATAVRDALVAQGIPAERIRVQAPIELAGRGAVQEASVVQISAAR